MVRQTHPLCKIIFQGFSLRLYKHQLSLIPPADNLTVNEQLTGPHAAGVNSILPKEHGSQFFYLPIIRHSDEEVSTGFDFSALLWPKGVFREPHWGANVHCCFSKHGRKLYHLGGIALRLCALCSCSFRGISCLVVSHTTTSFARIHAV